MTANTNDLIVIGIGPGSEILTFLTFGLGSGPADIPGRVTVSDALRGNVAVSDALRGNVTIADTDNG